MRGGTYVGRPRGGHSGTHRRGKGRAMEGEGIGWDRRAWDRMGIGWEGKGKGDLPVAKRVQRGSGYAV
jgi:hypothetical protein